MVAFTYLASALLTGLLLVAIVAAVVRARQWRSYSAGWGGDSGRDRGAAIAELARTPLAWTVAFLVLLGVVGAGTLAFVIGSIPAGVSRAAGMALAAVVAAGLCGYLFWGVHHATRNRGFKRAQAAAVGVWTLALVFVGVIVAQLAMA